MERQIPSRNITTQEQPVQEQPKPEEIEPTTKFEPTPDDDFELDNGAKDLPFRKESEDAVKKLVDYIEQQMEYFNNKLTFAAAGVRPPTPYEIEMALASWLQTSFSINSMYELAQADADNAEAEYNQYFNIKKSETRTKFNKIDMKKASWLSATEIEATTYSVYRNDIAKLEANVTLLKRQASFLKSMQKSWSDYLWVLRTLKDMAISEMQGSKITPDLRRGDETDL